MKTKTRRKTVAIDARLLRDLKIVCAILAMSQFEVVSDLVRQFIDTTRTRLDLDPRLFECDSGRMNP